MIFQDGVPFNSDDIISTISSGICCDLDFSSLGHFLEALVVKVPVLNQVKVFLETRVLQGGCHLLWLVCYFITSFSSS